MKGFGEWHPMELAITTRHFSPYCLFFVGSSGKGIAGGGRGSSGGNSMW